MEIFSIIGVVATLLVAGGVFIHAINKGVWLLHNSYYHGLRRQISDTVADIDKYYESDDLVSARAVKDILVSLNSRHWPAIGAIKAADKAYIRGEC